MPPLPAREHALLIAEMDVRAQEGILWRQREGLRHALGRLGACAPAPWWREQIADTEQRLAAALARLEGFAAR